MCVAFVSCKSIVKYKKYIWKRVKREKLYGIISYYTIIIVYHIHTCSSVKNYILPNNCIHTMYSINEFVLHSINRC